jgi:hypothetical protein
MSDETKARITDVHHAIGKTQDVVRCPCGHYNYFYRWSWAGHGKARCLWCGRWITYKTLEVYIDHER